jgi:hypothetical protein
MKAAALKAVLMRPGVSAPLKPIFLSAESASSPEERAGDSERSSSSLSRVRDRIEHETESRETREEGES